VAIKNPGGTKGKHQREKIDPKKTRGVRGANNQKDSYPWPWNIHFARPSSPRALGRGDREKTRGHETPLGPIGSQQSAVISAVKRGRGKNVKKGRTGKERTKN